MNAPFRIPSDSYGSQNSVTLSKQVVAAHGFDFDLVRPTRFLRVSNPGQTTVAARFRRLADTWLDAVLNISSVDDMILHPSYQEIIGMGPAVIPFLLDELERVPNHWFAALTAVSGGQNPIADDDEGDIDRMAEAWLRWGKINSYR